MFMKLQYSYLGWNFKLSIMKGLVLCFLMLLSNGNSSYASLVLNRTEIVMFREQHRRTMLDNGLGQTPPMG